MILRTGIIRFPINLPAVATSGPCKGRDICVTRPGKESRWRQVAQGLMGPVVVVVGDPLFGDVLNHTDHVEQISAQHPTKAAIQAFSMKAF